MPGTTRDPPLQWGSFLRRDKLGSPLWLVLAAVVIGFLVGTIQLVRGPAFVASVTVVNPNPYNLQVSVTDGSRHGWMAISDAAARGTTTTEQVVDQGSTWVFRFEYLGNKGGEVVVDKSQLAQDGWKLTVPEAVGQNLASRGLPATPERL